MKRNHRRSTGGGKCLDVWPGADWAKTNKFVVTGSKRHDAMCDVNFSHVVWSSLVAALASCTLCKMNVHPSRRHAPQEHSSHQHDAQHVHSPSDIYPSGRLRLRRGIQHSVEVPSSARMCHRPRISSSGKTSHRLGSLLGGLVPFSSPLCARRAVEISVGCPLAFLVMRATDLCSTAKSARGHRTCQRMARSSATVSK